MENQLFIRKGKALHCQLHGGKCAYATLPRDAQTSVLRQVQGALWYVCGQGIHPGQGLNSSLLPGHFLRRPAKAVFVNQAHKFQLLKQFI